MPYVYQLLMFSVIQLLMSISLQTTNILFHITTYCGRFEIILKLLDQMSIVSPLAPFCSEYLLIN